jgi:hypothetical protein
MRASTMQPSPTAVHEAAHHRICVLRGFTDVASFLDRDGADGGRTYGRAPTKFLGCSGVWLRRSGLEVVKRLAAAAMAGPAAEAMFVGVPVPGWRALLEGESPPGDKDMWRDAYEPLLVRAAVELKGELEDADFWCEVNLPAVRTEVLIDLRLNWRAVLAHARRLERRKGNA